MYFNKSYISLSVLITIFLLSVVNFNVEFAHFYTQQYETVENRDFWACNFIQEEYYIVHSQLLAVGDHCYIYMDEDCIAVLGEESVMVRVEDICNEFDEVIYPRIIDLAGHPNGTMGDIDGDPRIFILFNKYHNYYS